MNDKVNLADFEVIKLDRPEQMMTEDGQLTPIYQEMYDLYCQCFQLEAEQVPADEFVELVARNLTTDDKAQESWVGLKDKKTGQIVAAANYGTYGGTNTPGIDGTVHDIFTMVHPDHRKVGVFGALLEGRMKAAQEFVGKPDARILAFAEQNNPLLMTANEYIEDTHAALDQCVRRSVFERENYQTLDFRYLQPPMGAGMANTYLDMVVQGAHGKPVPSELISQHLTRFFKHSFPEGTDLNHPEVELMVKDLKNNPTIGLKEIGRFKPMSEVLNVTNLENFPEEQKDEMLGKIYPRLSEAYFGKSNLHKFDLGKEIPQIGSRQDRPVEGPHSQQAVSQAGSSITLQ